MADFCLKPFGEGHSCYKDAGHEGDCICGLCDTFGTHDVCPHYLARPDCVACTMPEAYIAGCYSCGAGSWGWFNEGICLRCKKPGMEWFCNYTLPDGSEPCFEAVVKWSNDKLTGFCKAHSEGM